MLKVTMSAHQPLLPTSSETREPSIATNMGRQQELPLHQQIILAEQLLLIETVMAIQSAHLRLLLTISGTPQQLIVTAMGTRLERTGQAPITLETRTLDTLIPTATPEVHLLLQRTTLATQLPLIAIGTVTLKVLPLPQRTILEIVVPSSVATTPTLPSGLGNDSSSIRRTPKVAQHPTFGVQLFTNLSYFTTHV